jgi:uncharacterized membrane protein
MIINKNKNNIYYIFSIFIIILIIFSTDIFAAKITGTIYNLNLEKEEKAIVMVNSTPIQMKVAIEGIYNFNLNKGNYMIESFLIENNTILSKTYQEINIIDDGDYTIDLILLPYFEEDFFIFEEMDIIDDKISQEINEKDYLIKEKNNYLNLLLGGIIITIFIFIFIIILLIKSKINNNRIKRIREERKSKIKNIINKNEENKNNIINLEKNESDKEEKRLNSKEYDIKLKILEILNKEQGRTTQKEIRKHIPYSEAKISLVLSELEDEGKIKRIKKGRTNIIIFIK